MIYFHFAVTFGVWVCVDVPVPSHVCVFLVEVYAPYVVPDSLISRHVYGSPMLCEAHVIDCACAYHITVTAFVPCVFLVVGFFCKDCNPTLAICGVSPFREPTLGVMYLKILTFFLSQCVFWTAMRCVYHSARRRIQSWLNGSIKLLLSPTVW